MRAKLRLILAAVIALAVQANCSSSDPVSGEFPIKYEVDGTACAADVTYEVLGRSFLEVDVDMGWAHYFTANTGDFVFLSAENKCDTGTITVRIYKSGVVIESATSSEAFGVATASGTL